MQKDKENRLIIINIFDVMGKITMFLTRKSKFMMPANILPGNCIILIMVFLLSFPDNNGHCIYFQLQVIMLLISITYCLHTISFSAVNKLADAGSLSIIF